MRQWHQIKWKRSYREATQKDSNQCLHNLPSKTWLWKWCWRSSGLLEWSVYDNTTPTQSSWRSAVENTLLMPAMATTLYWRCWRKKIKLSFRRFVLCPMKTWLSSLFVQYKMYYIIKGFFYRSSTKLWRWSLTKASGRFFSSHKKKIDFLIFLFSTNKLADKLE